jgi:hypothetical protein
MASNTSESSPCSSSIASLSYSYFAKRSHSLCHEIITKLEIYLPIIWKLRCLVLQRKQISSLIGNELVKVNQTVEKDAYLCWNSSNFLILKVAFMLRSD